MKIAGASSVSGILYTFLAVSSISSLAFGQITSAPNLSTVTSATSKTATSSGKASSTASGSTSGATSTGSSTGSGSGSSTGTGTSSTGTQTVPSLTSSSAAAGLTGLPKLSNGYTIPTASVPETTNAPYMQSSSLPEGTVFIVVGAILGFMATTVLVWRTMTAWSLHRAMNRAAMSDSRMDKKSLFRTPAPPMYKYSDRESKASLSNFGGKAKKNVFGGLSDPASSQSLFFSPTAGAAGSSAGNAGNRNSSYLPAGYYAAGASAPGDGHGSTYIGSQPGRESISLTDLAPQSHGYARHAEYNSSPPDSPAFNPVSSGRNRGLSTSSLDLRLPNGRAPSAVLDDLFDGSAENLPRQGRH